MILEFYTLYGHLSEDSLNGLKEGQPVKKGNHNKHHIQENRTLSHFCYCCFLSLGEILCKIGNYPGNGNWPPHLHFQLIVDMLDRKGSLN